MEALRFGVSTHIFEKCGIVGGTTGVDLAVLDVCLTDLQMHMCGYGPCFYGRLLRVLTPIHFLKRQTSRRCSFRYILQGIAGSRDVQYLRPHARCTFAVPGFTACL